jgi:serine/threonine protein kinase
MLVANKYKVTGVLGNGAFGHICKAENIRTHEFVALKMEPLSAETKMLKNETKIYQYLSGLDGIPSVLWFGVFNNNFCMAMTLLGDSLQKIRQSSNSFSLEIVIQLSIKMVERLESVHNKGLIHRDVKPDNFLFGIEKNKNVLYLIDFGFCKKYRLDDNVTHIPLREGRKIIGTPNFVSINIHDGFEPSRRDDLESIVYIMIYLLFDNFEWTKEKELVDDNKINKNNIRDIKMKLMSREIIPKIIRKFFNYCRSLKFDETPNYAYIYNLLNNKY